MYAQPASKIDFIESTSYNDHNGSIPQFAILSGGDDLFVSMVRIVIPVLPGLLSVEIVGCTTMINEQQEYVSGFHARCLLGHASILGYCLSLLAGAGYLLGRKGLYRWRGC